MNEALLVELAREGRESAVDELFAQVWPLVWQWAYAVTTDRTLADHVAQDAIHRAFGQLDRFDPTRPFRPWLKRITVNLAIDELRRERRHEAARRALVLKRSEERENEGAHDPAITQAVRGLPFPQRLVVVLYYWLDLTVDDIAEMLEIPPGTVASRLSRARAILREEMEAYLDG